MRAAMTERLLTETRICMVLSKNPTAMTPREVSLKLNHAIAEVADLMERMYWASKLEKLNTKPPFYRIPGKTDGKLSLPN